MACWRCGPGRPRGRVAVRQADRAGPGRFDRLLHLGNVVVDIVVTVPALPERGGDLLASRAVAVAGGGRWNRRFAAIDRSAPGYLARRQLGCGRSAKAELGEQDRLEILERDFVRAFADGAEE